MARAKAAGCPKLSHNVTKSAQKPVTGKKTKTDKAPMSTPEFSGHMRRIK